ncbi:MAG: AAA family ATPase, partial [Candidatus Anstonellales archaeon]
ISLNKNIVENNAEDENNKKEKNVENDDIDEKGIEIEVKLPMKKLTSLDVLSGGERSLIGIAALFAIISVSPPPFLVLDEVDAMLDERNARKFAKMLKEFSHQTQFILVTHNRVVMEAADIIYGVTIGEDETSKIISLKFEN